MAKSGAMWLKEVKSHFMSLKVAKSGCLCLKWFYGVKSGFMWLNVVKSGCMWSKVVLCG